MRLLLDTNVISDFVRGVETVQSHLRASAPAELAVSAISVMEVAYGLERNQPRARRITPIVDALLANLSILEYSEPDARETGRVRAELEHIGKPIGLCDSMLAGTARRRGLTVVTRNTREFERVDRLSVLDWHLPT